VARGHAHPPYKDASYNNHEPLRSRKLLLKGREIAEIAKGLERKGLTLVPTRLYFKRAGRSSRSPSGAEKTL
jgi:tmRNA-binding protein